MSTYQKIDFLHALYIGSIVTAELMGSKTFPLWMLNASVAILLLPITFSINDMVFEVYGRERTLSFVRSALYLLGLLVLFNAVAVLLPPTSRFASSNDAYTLIFGKSLRITLASLIAFGISERLDVLVFSKIKQRMHGRSFWVRNNVSNICSLFIDTAIFMTIAFYQPDNITFLISLIIPHFLLKSSLSFMMTPFVVKGAAWLRKTK